MSAEKCSDSTDGKEDPRQDQEIQMESDGDNGYDKRQDRKKMKEAFHGNINSTAVGLVGNHGVILAHSHMLC